MTSNLDALAIRRRLSRGEWSRPLMYGPDGWAYRAMHEQGSIVITCAPEDDGNEWVHASIAYTHRLPTYDELKDLHAAVWAGRGWAYLVFAPPDEHINIHDHALHLFGRLDRKPALPDFTHGTGSI